MKSKRILTIITVFMVFVMLSGCQEEKYIGNSDTPSTTCGNIVMGQGKFAISNGFIYIAEGSKIYEYDMEKKSTVALSVENTTVASMYTQDNYIYYAGDGLNRIRKDGKKEQQVFTRKGGCIQLYVEGENAFFLESVNGDLYHRNLSDDTETRLMQTVLAYYVDENNIYAIARENDEPQLFVSSRENIEFTKYELSFSPIAVFVQDDAIYLAQRGNFQIIKVTEQGEEPLPIFGVKYQVIGDKILYRNSATCQSGTYSLDSYDMTTGENEIICMGVYDFNILDNRYVWVASMDSDYYMYDLETEKITLMYLIESK